MTFLPESFRRFVLDLTRGHDDLIVSAADLQAAAEFMAGPPVVAADFELDDNPLASGHWCPTCGTRLDRSDRPCPFSPHPEETR